eukprot:GHRR01003617.1.p1 GENE.GHRR01003617.1~~GHRR01003617.1.p1  ORF type:complete len:226 (+),score=87.32 GHRR01003617.1:130-807(+)
MGCSSSKPAARPSRSDPRLAGLQRQQQQTATTAAAAARAAVGPPPRVKLVLLGDSGVGKSCLVLRYIRGQFNPSSKITVGAAFVSHNVALPDGKSLKFEIWDTAGQERYLSLAPLYYRGAHAAAVVYDVSNPESFQKAKYWIGELQKNANGSIVMVLVGNKTDLAEQRQVSDEDGRAFADSQNMMFVEASAKTAAGVADIFEGLAAKLSGSGSVLPISVSASRVA